MSIITKIKAYIIPILSGALVLLYALFSREKALRQSDKAKVAEKTSQTLTEANKIIAKAEKKIKKKLAEKDPAREHFE